MKRSTVLWSVSLVVAFLGGYALSAQLNAAKPTSDPLDAVTAAPRNHKLLYQDGHVRLIEVIVQPGETENLHTHQYPTVSAFDAPQPIVDSRMADGSGIKLGRNFSPPAGAGPRPAGAPQLLQLGDLDAETKSGWSNGLPVVTL